MRDTALAGEPMPRLGVCVRIPRNRRLRVRSARRTCRWLAISLSSFASLCLCPASAINAHICSQQTVQCIYGDTHGFR